MLFPHVKIYITIDDAFFQSDLDEAYWGRWAGDRTVARLICWLRMWRY